jgi:integrase
VRLSCATFCTSSSTACRLSPRRREPLARGPGWRRRSPCRRQRDDDRSRRRVRWLQASGDGDLVAFGVHASTDTIQRKTSTIIPWVFHRTNRGRPLMSITKGWRAACLAAGLPGRIPHDFRRTAVRNLERAGVPRSTAMAMVRHQTEAIYRRYAIVDEVMLREGAAKLAAYSEAALKPMSLVTPSKA